MQTHQTGRPTHSGGARHSSFSRKKPTHSGGHTSSQTHQSRPHTPGQFRGGHTSTAHTSTTHSRPHSSGGHSSPARPGNGFRGRNHTFRGRPKQNGGGGGNKRRGRQENIDHSLFIYEPTEFVEVKKYEPKNTFGGFGLPEQLVKNLTANGLVYPTEIQDKIIPHGITGDDVIGLAQTGSGKTLAFLLPLIQKLVKDKRQKVIILAPTRELAQQINKELMDYTKGLSLFSTVCVGGMPIFRQIQSLRRVNHFVIGTPGRIKDLADRKVISFNAFHSIVLDEVDRMLDMGFVDDMTMILKHLPVGRQAFFFSATMPESIKRLISTFLKNPKVVDINSGVSIKNVTQNIVKTRDSKEKIVKLGELLKNAEGEKSIIFVETKRGVDKLSRELRETGFKVGLLHGDRRQRERDRTLQDFKGGTTNVLVATDVAARGIDVKDVFQVINYTIPQTHDSYIHRIGRTGRAGKTGKAFTFV